MYDKEARHIIEALRSGIPSRAVGQYFSEARFRLQEPRATSRQPCSARPVFRPETPKIHMEPDAFC